MKLTDEELELLAMAGRAAAEDCAEYTLKRGTPTYDDRRIGRMMARDPWVAVAERAVAELATLRALLATEMPCGWDEPRVVADPIGNPDGGPEVTANWLHAGLDPDEAIALGAALIAAGRRAKGETP